MCDSKKFKIHIISNIIVNELNNILEYSLRTNNINAVCVKTDYDNIIQNAEIYKESSCIIIFWELANITEDLIYIQNSISDQEVKALEEKEAKEAKAREERDTVRQLSDEAKALLESKRFEEALAKYHALSEIESAKELAMDGIKDTRTALKAFTEKMEYIDKVAITEFEAKRIDTYSDEDVPAIRVSLKNKGDRSLDKVKVIVYFQNKNGVLQII